MARKIDTYIDALFQVLPASNYEEIRRKMQKQLGTRFKPGLIGAIIAHLRKNVSEYGWTIPHVGGHPKDGEKRYFTVLVEKDGTAYFDKDHSKFLSKGSRTVVGTISTMAANMAVMLDVAIQYERSKARKDHLEDMAEQITFVAKRTKRIAASMDVEIERLTEVAA
jgi:hypothetical protein